MNTHTQKKLLQWKQCTPWLCAERRNVQFVQASAFATTTTDVAAHCRVYTAFGYIKWAICLKFDIIKNEYCIIMVALSWSRRHLLPSTCYGFLKLYKGFLCFSFFLLQYFLYGYMLWNEFLEHYKSQFLYQKEPSFWKQKKYILGLQNLEIRVCLS